MNRIYQHLRPSMRGKKHTLFELYVNLFRLETQINRNRNIISKQLIKILVDITIRPQFYMIHCSIEIIAFIYVYSSEKYGEITNDNDNKNNNKKRNAFMERTWNSM